MGVKRGLVQALTALSVLVLVGAAVAELWFVLDRGSFASRLGGCLLGLGVAVLLASGSVLPRVGRFYDTCWLTSPPAGGRSGDGIALTAEGLALLVGLPLAVAGSSLLALG